MNWQDKGYLLSKNKYNENSVISEFYTENHGKISGIIFGGTSKKIKNYLFEGNKLHINYNSKSQSKIGSLKVEIDEFKKHCLLNGLDDIALSLKKEKAISEFEARTQNDRPWV